jgi:hypothetical protein
MKAQRNQKKGKASNKSAEKRGELAIVVNPRNETRFFRNEERGPPAFVRRRMTRVSSTTGASGVAFAYAESSANVVNALEWSSLSQDYQQYRVRAMRVRIVPRNWANNSFAATVWYPGSVIAARYPSGSSASTVFAVYAEGGSQIFTSWEKMERMATMQDNEDAALWTNCNATIPALSVYGVQFLGTTNAPAIYNGVVTHDTFTDWDVEFMARN